MSVSVTVSVAFLGGGPARQMNAGTEAGKAGDATALVRPVLCAATRHLVQAPMGQVEPASPAARAAWVRVG